MAMHILVVFNRNEPEWPKILTYLKEKGISVQVAFSAQEAYRVLKNEPVSIVISDYFLKKVKGLSFLKKIKEIKPSVEVIFLSEKASLSEAIKTMKEGAYDFYEFPVNIKLLMTVIDKAIEKQSLYIEKVHLEQKIREKFDLGKFIGRSKAIARVIEIAESVASKNVNILITGESGTGKEMIANAVHYNSPRAAKSLIKISCAVFNEGVLESELFGHEKGAFTNAFSKRVGRFELAHGGSLFLDEIGDMPMGTQIKILRVLQERELERVGGNETIKVDVRVIAATNQDLKKRIADGKFREDLYYRLNVVHIELPPLRERKDDIPLLVSSFIHKLNEEKGYHIKGITQEATAFS